MSMSATEDLLGILGSTRNKDSILNIFENEVLPKFTLPYDNFLDCLEKGTDLWHPSVNSICCEAFKIFSAWIKNKSEFKSTLNSATKRRAFFLVSASLSSTIRTLAFKVYQLSDSPFLLRENIAYFQENQLFLQLSEWVLNFELQREFTLDQFLIPLVLLNELSAVLHYLNSSPHDQLPLAKTLDKYLRTADKPFFDQLSIEFNVVHKNKDKTINKYRLRKLLQSMRKSFSLPFSELPNLEFSMKSAFIMVLVGYWREHTISDDGFRELVEVQAGDDKHLRRQIADCLLLYNETAEVEYWSKKYNLEIELSQLITRRKPFDASVYYCFPNILNMIEFIGSLEDTNRIFEYLSKNKAQKIIGFDSEWMPGGLYDEYPISILQIAFTNKIFIIDVLGLDNAEAFWKKLNILLLGNKYITKLGYAFKNDSLKLRNSPLSFLDMSAPSFVDLQNIEKNLKSYVDCKKVQYPFKETGLKEAKTKGLQSLVFRCLGKPLDKRERMSNWNKRPLRDDQLVYAALDALVLINIHTVIKKMLKQLNIHNMYEFSIGKHNQSCVNTNQELTPESAKLDVNQDEKNKRKVPQKPAVAKVSAFSVNAMANELPSAQSSQEVTRNQVSVPSKKKLRRKKISLNFCMFCLGNHKIRICPSRFETFNNLLELFIEILINLRGFPIQSRLINVLKELKCNPVKFQGDTFKINREKILFPPNHHISRTFVRIRTSKVMIEFFKRINVFLNSNQDIINKTIKEHLLLQEKNINKRPWRKICKFCWKFGHIKSCCFLRNNLISLKNSLNYINFCLLSVVSALQNMTLVLVSINESQKKASENQIFKTILLNHKKCSYCFRFGHIDAFCEKRENDFQLLHLSLNSSIQIMSKCLSEINCVLW